MKKIILTIALSFLIVAPTQASIMSDITIQRLPTPQYLNHCPVGSFGCLHEDTKQIFVDTDRTTEFDEKLTVLHEICHAIIRPYQEWSEFEELQCNDFGIWVLFGKEYAKYDTVFYKKMIVNGYAN